MEHKCSYCCNQVSEKDWNKGYRECKNCYLEKHIEAGWRAEDTKITNAERICKKCNTHRVSIKEWEQGTHTCKICHRKESGWRPNSKRKKRKKKTRCIAITAKGIQCRNKVSREESHCKIHRRKKRKRNKVANPTGEAKVLAEFLKKTIRIAPRTERFKTRKGKLYDKYLRSRHWGLVRKEVRAVWKTCQLCNKNSKEMHVHHTNYKNIWEEQWGDLTLLCKKCHNKYHKKVRSK